VAIEAATGAVTGAEVVLTAREATAKPVRRVPRVRPVARPPRVLARIGVRGVTVARVAAAAEGVAVASAAVAVSASPRVPWWS
jgi:hypothetical protein